MDIDGRNVYELLRMKEKHHLLAETLIYVVYCSEVMYNCAIEAVEIAMQ